MRNVMNNGKATPAQSAVRLAYITTVPESLGFYRTQAQYLKRRGFAVYGLSSPGKSLAAFAASEQTPVYAVDMPRRITPLRDGVAVAQLTRILRHIQPQIVYASTPKAGVLGMIAAWLAGIPVRIYAVLGLPFMTATGYRRLLLTWSERIACHLAQQVFSVSHSVREIIVAAGVCPAAKVKVLVNGSVNGVDAAGRFNPDRLRCQRSKAREMYNIPAEAVVIGFIGRRVRDKGISELAAAWKRLRESYPDAYLLVAGPPEPQDPVPVATEQFLQHDARVRMTGFVDDIFLAYAAMDVFVLPTYREGFPVSLLEAAAVELPVVATRVPGCVDAIVDGVTGTLVPAYDAESLANAIRDYFDQPDLRIRHGRAARERVLRDFRPEPILEAVYLECIRLLNEKHLSTPSGTGV
jgi:glycosyltransferase involved in cell wall biosynthesis